MRNKWIKSSLSLAILATTANIVQAEETHTNADALLETIVVTASGSGINVKDAPASISVVTSEDIQRQPFSSLAEVLSDLPGVTGGYSNAGAGSKITFRGMPDKYTLILVDGKRIGNQSLLGHRPDKVDQDLNWISPDMIERIEVIRGSMSTLYGSEAVGGVINIITKKIPDRISTSLTGNYSKPDSSSRGETKELGATLAGPLSSTVGFRLGLNRTERDADSDSEGTSGSKNDTANARFNWAPSDNNSFNLDASWGEDKAETLPGAGEKFGYEMERYGLGIGHEGKYADGLVTNADVYYNKIRNKDASFVDDSKVKTQAQEFVVDLKAVKPLEIANLKNDLTLGAQYKYEQVSNSSNIGNQTEDKNGNKIVPELEPDTYSWSLFAEDQIHLKDNLIVTLGARLDDYEGFDLNLSPRGYVVYHPEDRFTVKGGVSRSFRAPNLKERSGSSGTGSMGMGCSSFEGWANAGSGRSCLMLGNPDLEPETSTNYELGFGYEEGGYGADMTFFFSDIKNLMQNNFHTRVGDKFYAIVKNVEEARTSGMEVTFKFPLTDYLRMTGNATYMFESKNKVTGATLLATPELTLNGALFWDVTDQLSLHSKVQYLGKQALTAADSTATFADPYTTLDVGANYNVNKNLTLRAGVQNVTGEKVDTGSDYGTGNPAVYYAGFTTRF